MKGNRNRPSGRFVLRLPPTLHGTLAESARRRGLSLNEYCVRSLSQAEAAEARSYADVAAKAIEQLGTDLVAVAVFGSFARGEAGPTSDVDVLIVASVEITRGLYAPWDVDDVVIEGRRVEPHYARMRGPDDPITGFWAEIALDAAVVYDPDLLLARELVRIRRAILAGAVERRSAGGHSWWTAG